MELKDFEEKQLSSKLVFDGAVVRLYFDKIRLPNGAEATREYLRHKGAVCILPLTPENEVICVRQFRYPFGKVMLEIRGKLDSKEKIRVPRHCAASRGDGAVCEELIYIGKYHPSPAILDEKFQCSLRPDFLSGNRF